MEGTILSGKGRPTVKYGDPLSWAVQKRLNRSRWNWVEDLGGPRNHALDGVGSWKHVLHGDEHWHNPGEYNWTIHFRRPCKNGSTDRDGISRGLRWVQETMNQETMMGSRLTQYKGAIFRGKDMPDDTVVSCAKRAEQIDMPFGLWIRVGTRKHVLGAVHTDATRRNHWNIHVWRQCGLFVKFLWPLVIIVSDAITRKMAEHFICRDSIKRELRWLRGRHSWICIRTSSALNKGPVKVQSVWMVATVQSLQGGKGTMQLIAERSHRRKNKCCCNQ